VKGGSPRRLKALIAKEWLQIMRDPSSFIIAFVLPMLLLFAFGYALSLDAVGLKLGLVLENPSPQSRSFAAALTDSRYFNVRIGHDRRDFEDDLLAGRIAGIVIVPRYFSERLARAGDTAPIQILTDASQPNTASFVQNYVRGAWQSWLQLRAREQGREFRQPVRLQPRYWFNTELNSHFFLVPGSVAIVMTLIGAILTALVVAREWERGTMEAMMATPITIYELLLGKLVPYYIMGMGSMFLTLFVSVEVFHVPFRGSFAVLCLVATVFLMAALGLGLLISTLARNQFVAAQVALLAAFLPSFLLSGFIFEISSMPWPIQIITRAISARYFVSSLQTLFLAGDIWAELVPDILAMLVIAAVLFSITALKTVKRLD
jgi:ABC-2 type transport system permease protein